MTMAQTPQVLVVDDRPDEQRSAAFNNLPAGSAKFVVRHPTDIDIADLNDADLVLVDYVIDHWPERENVSQLSLKPANGVALAALLREHAPRSAPPTGFAIHTAQPDALWLSPAEPRRHLIARAYNLEWVFLKSNPPDVVRQATILAKAIRSLPNKWPVESYERTLAEITKLLGLGHEPAPIWTAAALADVEDCRPPLTELSERNHGLVFLRWLLHRILPYPCFLLDSHRVAARLRVTHAAFERALGTGLGNALATCRYQGILDGFLGERWWRVGVEDWLWALSDGVSLPANEIRAKLSRLAGVELTPSGSDSPVVCVDENYQTLPEAYTAADVVRIQPDDWPLYASQAWATVESVRQHPRLRAIVAAEDRDRLASEGGAGTDAGGPQ
jgi:hypothetical protein